MNPKDGLLVTVECEHYYYDHYAWEISEYELDVALDYIHSYQCHVCGLDGMNLTLSFAPSGLL